MLPGAALATLACSGLDLPGTFGAPERSGESHSLNIRHEGALEFLPEPPPRTKEVFAVLPSWWWFLGTIDKPGRIHVSLCRSVEINQVLLTIPSVHYK